MDTSFGDRKIIIIYLDLLQNKNEVSLILPSHRKKIRILIMFEADICLLLIYVRCYI